MNKFGKSNLELLQIKKNFYVENDALLETQLNIGRVYRKQETRVSCKNCNHALGEIADFTKQKIPYLICKNCTHINGRYQDSEYFCRILYSEDAGKQYAKNYEAACPASYIRRAVSIYLPKVEFLLNSLGEQESNASNLKFCDFGCGSGYFLYAL